MFTLGERRLGGKIFQILKGWPRSSRKESDNTAVCLGFHALELSRSHPQGGGTVFTYFSFFNQGGGVCVINLLSDNLTRRHRVLLHLAASLQFDLFCGSGV